MVLDSSFTETFSIAINEWDSSVTNPAQEEQTKNGEHEPSFSSFVEFSDCGSSLQLSNAQQGIAVEKSVKKASNNAKDFTEQI